MNFPNYLLVFAICFAVSGALCNTNACACRRKADFGSFEKTENKEIKRTLSF